jgi:Cu/Ag efflux pump CusA
MLKVASLINRYSSLIVVVLATPVLAIFFSQSFQLQMIPQSPNVRYLLEFEVPARTGDEVFARVTEPTERVLNGLPGLLSFSL